MMAIFVRPFVMLNGTRISTTDDVVDDECVRVAMRLSSTTTSYGPIMPSVRTNVQATVTSVSSKIVSA